MPSVEEVQALVEDRLSRCVGPRAGAAGHRGDPQRPSRSATDRRGGLVCWHAVGYPRTDDRVLYGCRDGRLQQHSGKALAMPGRESRPTVRSASDVDL
jgi:hypothetical protein